MVRSLAIDMVPDVGVYSPVIIFSRVVLPVPLAPIRPIFSPGLMCQLASSYNARAPISNVRLLIAIIWPQRYGFEVKGGTGFRISNVQFRIFLCDFLSNYNY